MKNITFCQWRIPTKLTEHDHDLYAQSRKKTADSLESTVFTYQASLSSLGMTSLIARIAHSIISSSGSSTVMR